MKVAFLIQCHQVTPALDYTLSKICADERVSVYIHVDKKSDINGFRRYERLGVKFVADRIQVEWGHVSQFQATLALMQLALRDGFDYCSLISGDDVLVGDLNRLCDFLESHKNTEFFGVAPNRSEARVRVAYLYPKFFFRKKKSLIDRLGVRLFKFLFLCGFLKNELASDLPPLYKGSCWFTLSQNAVGAVFQYIHDKNGFLDAFKYSYCADEVVLQTALMHLGFGKVRYLSEYDCHDDNACSLRYIDWKTGPDYPRALDANDVFKIKSSGCFFARKMSSNFSVDDLRKTFG